LHLEKQHFERWLLLFKQTIDTYFEGTMAEETKKKADTMAIMFLSRIENMNGNAGKVIV
jgi:hemoglobin